MPLAVFFDLDGTLYDKRGLGRRIVRDALLRGRLSKDGPYRPLACLRLLSLERRERRALSGVGGGTVGYDTLFARVAARARRPADEVRQWYEEWYMKTMVAELEAHYTIDRKAVAMAESYRERGVKVAVLSDYGCVREKIEALGGHPEMFDALLDAPSLGGFKPSPEVFVSACRVLGADPSECEMVGDRPDTDGGCTAVGMKFTLFPLIALLLTVAVPSFAQEDEMETYAKAAREQAILYRGRLAPQYNFVHNGTWFIESTEFKQGEVMLGGRLYKDVSLNIDACAGMVVTRIGAICATDTELVDYAVIGGTKYINPNYRGKIQGIPQGFCKAVFEGSEYSFYTRIEKRLLADEGYHNGRDIGYDDPLYRSEIAVGGRNVKVTSYFRREASHYIVKDGVAKRVRSKAGILKMFDRQSAAKLRKYASDLGLNDSKVSIEKYAAKVLAYAEAEL